MITKALRGINFSKGVNVSSKLSTKLQKNHQNQEKTFVWSICHFVISSFRHFVTSQLVWGMINRGSTVKNILYIYLLYLLLYIYYSTRSERDKK